MIEITDEMLVELDKNERRTSGRRTLKECVGWIGPWTAEERQEIRDAIQVARETPAPDE